ncbi:unnamed protein product [Clonostachys rhizophaga]|uniref:NAD(P)-binding domain-containing protein n=1 Tax=Clonostachys rhizophaga TaxID=160324 RepID=A0A9N9V8M0_9HYPO|nr:unnamed protein product [Clonostachys rhizophaga]
MSSIKKVAIIGNVGSAVLAEFLKNGLDVTVISRSSQEVPAGARAAQADYNSITSLSSALKGHDAVVSAVGAAGIVGQEVIMMPPFLLASNKAAAGEIEYTILSTGAFLDFVFGTPLFVDFQNRSVEFYGDDKLRLSSTSIAGIGKAVAGTLVNADKTKNRVLHIQETVVSQVKVLDLAKTAAPEGAGWKEMSVDPEETLGAARVNAAKNPGDTFALYALIKAIILSGKYETEYREVDNDLIGLVQLTDGDLKAQFVPLLARAP